MADTAGKWSGSMPDSPNVKDLANKGELTQRMKDFLVDLNKKIQKDDDDRMGWKQKMIVAINQRLGVKRWSDFPYPGAPDVPLPETDKLIKKQVPNLVLSAWSAKTMCSVKVAPGYAPNPEWDEKAKKTELAMNVILRSKRLGWFKKLVLAADYSKQHGHTLFRTREEFTTRSVHKVLNLEDYEESVIAELRKMTNKGLEQFIADRFSFDVEDDDDLEVIRGIIKQFRSGKNVIEFDMEQIESWPNVDVPLPTKVIVPAYTKDIRKAQRITYEYFLSLNEIEDLMDQEIFRKKDLKAMSLTVNDDDIIEQQKTRNEGVTDNVSQAELFRIHETYTYYRENDTDKLQRWVFTRLADCTSPEGSLLADIEFPYEFEDWNWTKYDNEIKDERYLSSRGLPEQVRAYQEIMERSMNNMLIRDEMANTPMWEVLSTSDLLDDHIRFVPGMKLPVKALGGEIAPIASQAAPDMASASIMQLVKAHVEEYQSSNDYLFRNATNSGGGKTMGEINFGIQNNSAPLSLEVTSWNEALSNVYQQMFDILKERMGDSMYMDGVEITREDFNFPAEVKSNGELEMSNQNLATQKAFMRVQTILNPALADIVDSEDRFNAMKDWLEKDGVKDPDQFITDPKEIAQSQIAQLQQQLGQLKQQVAQMAKMAEEGQKENFKLKKEKSKAQAENEADDEMEIEKAATESPKKSKPVAKQPPPESAPIDVPQPAPDFSGMPAEGA
jgi:hypothetical protein